MHRKKLTHEPSEFFRRLITSVSENRMGLIALRGAKFMHLQPLPGWPIPD